MLATLPGDQGYMLLLEGCIEGSTTSTPPHPVTRPPLALACPSTRARLRKSATRQIPTCYYLEAASPPSFSPTSCFCHTRLSLSVSAINPVAIEIETPYSSMPYHSYLITCQATSNTQRNSWSINRHLTYLRLR